MGWHFEQETVLRRMWAEGYSASVIALAVGKSRNAVLGKRDRLGLPSRKTQSAKSFYARRSPAREKPPANHAWRKTWKPKAKRRKEPKPATPPPSEGTVSFMDRNASQCSYIYGEPNGLDTMCCGMKVKLGSSFCEAHHKACWTKSPKREKRRQKSSFAFHAVGAR